MANKTRSVLASTTAALVVGLAFTAWTLTHSASPSQSRFANAVFWVMLGAWSALVAWRGPQSPIARVYEDVCG